MRRRLAWSLRTWLTASHLVVLALPLLAILATGVLVREMRMQARGTLIHEGSAVARLVVPVLRDADATGLRAALADIEADTDTRLWLLDARGRVVASTATEDLGERMTALEEVRRALAGERAAGTHPLSGGGPRVVVATPVVDDGEVLGVVLAARRPMRVARVLRFMGPTLSRGIAAALLLTLVLSLASAWGLARSLGRLARASRRLAEGEAPPDELAALARSRVVEVRALARDLAATAERLSARMAWIQEFAGNVAHEFKTPIATLRGTVELLADDPDMPAEQRRRFLANALAELRRMESLIDGLLALARAEEPGEREVVDLDTLVDRVVARFPEARREGRAGSARAAPAQVEAAIANLVDNAFRHGGPPVRVRTWADGERVGVDVEDGGPGISPGNLDRVFDRFFTTARDAGGVGLGLPLVRAIARAHGGDVTVTRADDRTVFRLALPRAHGR